jgi:phosphatidylinositol-3-phosphatase
MSCRPARVASALAALALAVCTSTAATAAVPAAALPPIHHVFVLVLENRTYEDTFGAHSGDSYLGHTLAGQGALLRHYYGIGHASLDNYVALVSGQAPNEDTQLDCSTYTDFRPSAAGLTADGQLPGTGCVYPKTVRTLPDQLEAAGLSWRGYMEDMGRNPARDSATCAHVPLGQADATHKATPTDQYAAKHNPFVYFHSIIDDQARCDKHVVNLEQLPQDLGSIATTANYIFIVPNLCNDGHDAHCVDGRTGGLPAIDAFLRQWVPVIERSAAFRADGLLVITFDEADGKGVDGSSACCGEKPLPGAKYSPGFNGPGGGRIGAVVLSPFVKPGTVSDVPYNHYSLLRTVEAIFGLEPLGYAAQADLRMFGPDIFTSATALPKGR